ncbi:MAG TPA: histidine kinase [Flavobacterium sp.]|jgi:sensor histidine kinase YesM
MKKSIVLVIHIGFWFSYFLLLFIIIAAATHDLTAGPSLGYIIKVGFPFVVVPSLLTFYLFYFFLFPKYIQTRKIGRSFLYGVLISICSALVSGLLIRVLFGAEFMFRGGYTSFIAETASIALAAFIVGIVSLLIKGFITWYDEIKLKEDLNLKNHQVELALVKLQLDPHFLFNTINNIDVLILKSPKLASEYLNKLSDILRFMLFETKTDKIALSKEIEYIWKYIALQKIRTSNDNFVGFTINGDTSNKTIPSMLLIPFVENAFKHISNKKMENAITLSLSIDNEKIIFKCENKFSESNTSLAEFNGIGNDLIRKRIALLYPKKHTLRITDQNNIYKVEMVLLND